MYTFPKPLELEPPAPSAAPRCWCCGGPLTEHTATTLPPGKGEFRGFCRRCQTWTWYERG